MQAKKQQLELDIKQWTGSKMGREFVKDVQWNAVKVKLWDFWPRPQETRHLPFSPPGALSYHKEVRLAYWRDRVEREKPASLRSS